MTVKYSIANINSRAYVWLEIRKGDTLLIPRTFLADSKDLLGMGEIQVNGPHTAVWASALDDVVFNRDEVEARVYAVPWPSLSKGLLATTAYPGAGQSAVGGSNRWLCGAVGYASLGAAIGLGLYAGTVYGRYLTTTSPTDADRYFTQAQNLGYTAFACGGVALFSWTIGYAGVVRQHKIAHIAVSTPLPQVHPSLVSNYAHTHDHLAGRYLLDKSTYAASRTSTISTAKGMNSAGYSYHVDDQYGSIEANLPHSVTANPDAIAVLVSCEKYQQVAPLAISHKNHELMRRYLVEVMGFRPESILEYKDATNTALQECFGVAGSANGILNSRIKPGVSDVFVYFSGHGAPDGQTGSSYLAPVDANPSNLAATAYHQKTLYENLSKMQAKSVTVLLDACFSGTDLLKDVSPGIIISRPPGGIYPKQLVLAASTSDRFAAHFPQKEMGMFTYFVLRAMHDAKHADTNADKKLTWGEIHAYISNTSSGVPYYAKQVRADVEQVPELKGADRNRVVFEYK